MLLHYEIGEEIGRGGMGIVYRARDTHLDRDVAIKILPPEKVSNPERKLRFVQEAKTASALNHPNIVTIHDISTVDGIDFIVMEFIRGQTLDQLIPRKGMRLSQALACAVQVADALSKAHAAGITHRDLKPSNVMVNQHGLAKVLDFGLAKLAERAPTCAEDATLTQRAMTEEGAILGTVAYMSPEQAEARDIDSRSDIFSFGVLFYEMITGQRAFSGDSRLATLSAILEKNPPPIPDAPRDLDKILRRCLRKDPARRFQTMADLKVALEELKEDTEPGRLGADEVPQRRVSRTPLFAVAALAAALLVVLVLYFRQPAPTSDAPPLQITPLTAYEGVEQNPSFSPDGNQVAFSWNGERQDNWDIHIKPVGTGPPLRLTNNPAPESNPAWSPDGRYIAFRRPVESGAVGIFLMPPLGGPERKLAEARNAGIASITGRADLGGITWSADSRWLAVSHSASPSSPPAIHLVSVESGELRALTEPPVPSMGDFDPAFSQDGASLVFVRGESILIGNLFIQKMAAGMTAEGFPTQLTSAKGQLMQSPVWAPGPSILFRSGTLASPSLWRVSAAPGNKPSLMTAMAGGSEAAFSPSSKRLVFVKTGSDANIWRLHLDSSQPAAEKTTLSSTLTDYNPQYSPDGNRVAFSSARSGYNQVWVAGSDGSGAVQLTSFPGFEAGTPRWSPDGKVIAFDCNAEGSWDIYTIPSGGGRPRLLTPNQPAEDAIPSWSPDGKWIYFESTRTGTNQVWRMAPDGSNPVQVTKGGGHVPFLDSSGQTLYYTKASVYETSLWRMPAAGGLEEQVLPEVYLRNFALAEKGIYFASWPDNAGISTIRFYDFSSRTTRDVYKPSKSMFLGLALSPDGKSILFAQTDQQAGDLMLIENFR